MRTHDPPVRVEQCDTHHTAHAVSDTPCAGRRTPAKREWNSSNESIGNVKLSLVFVSTIVMFRLTTVSSVN